jgi:hypothetical protein
MRKNSLFFGLVAGTAVLFLAAFLLYSCSGSGSTGTGASGTVALYATDNLSDYQQVTATINKVTVLNTGSGASCDVLTTPTTINIANLSNVLQLLTAADCPAVPYNRLHIEFDRSVELMDSAGTQSSCAFVSYKDNSNRPNVLDCKGTTCTMDINGAVNVLVNHSNGLALDFKLKDFDIASFSTPSCSVTMKVSPIHGQGFGHLGYPERITGLVSSLTTSTHTFDLAKHHMVFHVVYSGITSTQQPGLDELLLRAQQDGLRTRVTASTIDFNTRTIDASEIFVKVEGLVSNLTATNFTLTYRMGKTMTIDYSIASVTGALANDAWMEVKLYGFDGATSSFLAARVEVEYNCTVPYVLKRARNTED